MTANVSMRVLLAVAVLTVPMAAAAEPPGVRLYTMDCGTLMLEPRAMTWFDDTDAYAETPGVMPVPCFLVRHPDGDLLWNAGMGDDLAQRDVVDLGDGITTRVTRTLEEQLAAIDLTWGDIEFVAFSHHHYDHTGNAPRLTKATYLINRKEMDWTRGAPYGVTPDDFSRADDANTRLIDLDHDVFGDGSARILRAPGHTPGHQVLMLRLADAGTVILSGDLYHTRENFQHARVPLINYSRADTLASFDRVAGLVDRYDARIVIEHDRRDIAALPEFPDHLD